MVVMVVAYCLHRRKRRYPPVTRASHVVGLLHPGRDVPLVMQHAPNVDVIGALDVEHEVRVAWQWPGAQPGQVEFVGVTRRARCRMASDVPVGLLQRIDEAKGHGLIGFSQIVGNGLINIPVGLLTRDDRFALHALASGLADWRTRSLRPSK